MPRTRSKSDLESASAASSAHPVDPAASVSSIDPADPAPNGPDLALEAVVRLHAYRLWERRGRSDGHAMEDWLQAEAELAHLGGASRSRLSRPQAEGAR